MELLLTLLNKLKAALGFVFIIINADIRVKSQVAVEKRLLQSFKAER